MKKGEVAFSYVIFWLENLFYIVIFAFYELMLVPFIYIKVAFDIIRLATFFNMIWLTFMWLLFGLLYLLFGVFKDMFFFVKTLCDYKDEDDKTQEKELEDFK